jgi:hypothetical protein
VTNFQNKTEKNMTESTIRPALTALNNTAALAASNVIEVRAAAESFRVTQENYTAILARAAAGEDVPETEFEAAEQALMAARRRAQRRAAIASIHGRAISALLPIAQAEIEQQPEAGELAQ